MLNFHRLLLRKKILPRSGRLVSSAARRLVLTKTELDDGAWAVFSGLEKAKEAQYVNVARLASSLEAILPNQDGTLAASIHNHQQHRIVSFAQHTSDPAFCSLPDIISDPNTVSGDTVRTLLKATRGGRRVDLATIEALVTATTRQMQRQPRAVMLPSLEANQQLTVIGDLHGSLSDLEAVLGLTGEPHRNNLLVFNGDLADRGDHGVEIIVIVCALCLAYPGCVHINRGNHEDLSLSIAYGLAAEVQHKYGASLFKQRVGPLLDSFFRSLPLATIVEQDAFIVHAGPPPPNIDLLAYLQSDASGASGPSRTIRTSNLETDITEQERTSEEVIEALLWSDPIMEDGGLADYHESPSSNGQGWIPNISRGAGHKYDSSMVRHVLETEGLNRFVRSHEPVQKGCERYTISRRDDPPLNKTRPLEFFTVFSASRYPHKEGFNQGAILKLLPNGKHSVTRYATEEDDPIAGSCFTSFDEDVTCSPLCVVDSESLLRALQGAAGSQRLKLVDALEELANQQPSKSSLPFQEVGDTIIETLMLDEPGLDKSGARLALARALKIQCDGDCPPETVDLTQIVNALVPEDTAEFAADQEMAPYYPWLRAVFEMVDVNHDGVLSRYEWMDAVDTINANLPHDSHPINAEATWELLDLSGNGRVTSTEWDELGKVLCR